MQKNANVKFVLATEYDSWAEERNALLWYRSYVEHMKEDDKKHVLLSTGLGETSVSFYKKSFAKNFYVNISLEYDTKSETRKQKESAVRMALLPTMAQYSDEF